MAVLIAGAVAWLTPLDELPDESAESLTKTLETPHPPKGPAALPTVVLPSQAVEISAQDLRAELFQLGAALLTHFPKLPEALHVVAWMYADLQRATDAERIWQDCIRLSPSQVGPYVGLATAAMEQGKDEEAVATLKRGMSAGCASPELDHQLAAALTKLGRLQEAAEVLQRGLGAFSQDSENWLQLGQIQIQLSPVRRGGGQPGKSDQQRDPRRERLFLAGHRLRGRASRTRPPSIGRCSASGRANKPRRGTRHFNSAMTPSCGEIALASDLPRRHGLRSTRQSRRGGAAVAPSLGAGPRQSGRLW